MAPAGRARRRPQGARALAGSLKTTARRGFLQVLCQSGREQLVDCEEDRAGAGSARFRDLDQDGPEVSGLRGEQRMLLRRALADLPERHRQLLELLLASPPVSYRDISSRLGMPVGSIGPTRARVLAHLREAPAPVGVDDLVLS